MAGGYTVAEGFAEIDAPVLKNQIVNDLSLNAAGRITVAPGSVEVIEGDALEIKALYWLPKEIAEMPRVEAPGPRRDEGVDEHPRPRNNAGI